EDGIRDFHVTGVQTCALPILLALVVARERIDGDDRVDTVAPDVRQLTAQVRGARVHVVGILREHLLRQRLAGRDAVLARVRLQRSEERRVGKGVSTGWSLWSM